MIILLDLNYTLVANSWATSHKAGRFRPDVAAELYRLPLVELVKAHHVALVTHRGREFEQATLDHIEQLTGWRPDEAHFNEHRWTAPRWKQHVLTERIMLKHGIEPERYLAIESNDATAAMYRRYEITCLKVNTGQGGRQGRSSDQQKRLL